MGISFKHIFRASQTIFSHSGHLSQSLYLSLFDFEHLLNQSNFPLLFNKFPPVLSILRSLDGNSETCCLSHIYFTLNLRIDSQLSRFNISLTNAPKTPFPGRPILLPNPQLLILFSLDNFAIFLSFFKWENKFIGWQSKRILLVFTAENWLSGWSSCSKLTFAWLAGSALMHVS